MIKLFLRNSHTIGDSIMEISLLNSLDSPVEVYTNYNSIYISWKKIFNIGDRVNIIEMHDHRLPRHLNPNLESFKVFSPYIQPESVLLWNHQFPTGRLGKKFVAVFVNNGLHVKDQNFWDTIQNLKDRKAVADYPFNKFYSKQTFNRTIDLIQSAGYDPIIVDNIATSLEHKVFILNELCDFAIGYEGGMCHLAHCLRIPVIMYPWIVQGSNTFHNSWLHLDKKTYFLKDTDEINSWTPAYLLELVDNLRKDGGNNEWILNKTFPDINPLLDHLVNSGENWHKQLEWILAHTSNPTLGGF